MTRLNFELEQTRTEGQLTTVLCTALLMRACLLYFAGVNFFFLYKYGAPMTQHDESRTSREGCGQNFPEFAKCSRLAHHMSANSACAWIGVWIPAPNCHAGFSYCAYVPT